jgi:ABC-type Fe3+ transport system substrate-binding protein
MADGPKFTALGKVVIVMFILACFGGAYYMLGHRFSFTNPLAKNGPGGSAGSPSLFGGTSAEIGIAYGTEKRRWLEWAVDEFGKTSSGKNIKVNLIPMGSIEGAHALLSGDQRLNVWSPASATYKDVFVQDWQAKYNTNPILREEPLALTPMVFVMWDERYQAFLQKYKVLSFDTIAQAEQEKSGWETIAAKPEWGFFKFGHTNPSESNSGLMTLVLASYTYSHKTRGLELKDVVNGGFQDWLQKIERGVSGMSNSTGNMMQEMVLKGPSSYDVLFVYENVTIDFLKNAEGRWGALRVVYPEYNAWNENPYYIINATWSTKEQRSAAETFLKFLLTEPIQKQSLVHGFRPANPNVPVNTPDGPFTQFARYGIQVDLQKITEPPKAEVVTNLLTGWQRTQGGR